MSTQPTPGGDALKKLLVAFATMSHENFLAGVQASCGFEGGYVHWQHEAEAAIGALEEMARCGDGNAIKRLQYLASSIALTLQELASLAIPLGEPKIEALFEKLTSRLENSDGSWRHVTEDDLEILASLPDEQLYDHISLLESQFPGRSTVFLPKCLLKISQAEHDRSLPYLDNPEELHAPELESLEILLGKLASLRARAECVRAVREAVAHAEEWPVPLRAIKELRNAQLEEFERLEIGSKLPIPVTPLKGSGKTREFLGQGRAAFAYKIYVQLERERNLPRHPAHLESIRESYKEYFEQNPEPEDNYSKEGVPKLIRAGEAKVWNRSNRWKAEAALLRPLSADNDVLESWTQAGFELVVFLTRNLSQLKPLLDFLKNKITESTDAPSRKKIKTEVTSALRDGFRSILSGSRRTQDAPPASNNPRN